jgi:serine/threonine protein kinase
VDVEGKREKEEEETAETVNLALRNDDLGRGAGPRRFSYGELALATYNFSNERKLGEGGFGAVYKGYLTDLDIPIAVKKISSGSKQGK